MLPRVSWGLRHGGAGTWSGTKSSICHILCPDLACRGKARSWRQGRALETHQCADRAWDGTSDRGHRAERWGGRVTAVRTPFNSSKGAKPHVGRARATSFHVCSGTVGPGGCFGIPGCVGIGSLTHAWLCPDLMHCLLNVPDLGQGIPSKGTMAPWSLRAGLHVPRLQQTQNLSGTCHGCRSRKRGLHCSTGAFWLSQRTLRGPPDHPSYLMLPDPFPPSAQGREAP